LRLTYIGMSRNLWVYPVLSGIYIGLARYLQNIEVAVSMPLVYRKGR